MFLKGHNAMLFEKTKLNPNKHLILEEGQAFPSSRVRIHI